MHILLPLGSRVCAFALLIAVFHVVSHGQQPQATIPTAQPADALRQYEEASRLYDQRQYDKAIELATNAAALLPKNYLPWALIGDCYVAQQKMKSASQAFAKSVEINPFAEKVWYWKAYADRERSAREESVAAAKEAIFLDEKYAAAYEIMGEALSLGNYDTKGAIEAFRTAVKLKPDLIVASEHLGSE
ncbi:MAG TPA: tetratricopeptide repeat protein, partial [Pyrinomonadaceae bacterium]|nr:tetratricopeptide repeat protein [Pyrinomonadaceae bacterium]